MKRLIPTALVCLMGALGCADPYAACPAGPTRQAVAGSVDAIGGLKRWQSVDAVSATAVVSLYDKSGKALLSEQQMVIDVMDGTLRASSVQPRGRWQAKVEAGRKPEFKAEGSVGQEELEAGLLPALETVLHHVRGPLNLCLFGETPAGSEVVRVEGTSYLRMALRRPNAQALAYYLDPQTYTPRMITAGGDQAGAEGAVSTLTYTMLPNGLAFPSRIAIVKIGQHVLTGEQPVLTVEFRQVKVRGGK